MVSSPLIPQDHILLLRPALEYIEHPVQPPLLALGAHVRADVVAVDRRRLGDHADHLLRVLLDVGVRARPDEVQLEVGRLLAAGVGAGGRQVPPVDVIVAEVGDVRDRGVEGLEDGRGLGCEGGAFGDQDALLAIDGAEDDDAAAALVCSRLKPCQSTV